MKKTIKIMSILLLSIMLISSFSSIALAADDETNASTVKGALDAISNPTEVTGTGDITSLGGKIVTVIQVISIVVAVIVILVIGIKYLVSSPEGKAEYKKTMIPYLIGAVLIFAGTTIVNMVYNMAMGLK